MGTVIALASRGGIAIAGDRRAVDDGTVTSRNVERVFSVEDAGVGAVGEPADVQAFRRELEAELRETRIDESEEMSLDRLARVAARLADRSDVAAVIGARDADGTARLRRIGPDGGVFEQSTVALGDGAELAVGQLETVDSELDVDALVATLTEILERVAARDVESGAEIDHWSLSHAGDDEN